jgi:hypothetical protein
MSHIKLVVLIDLITDHRVMVEVMGSGRRSESPDQPVWLKRRVGLPGKWEIADGHHRVNEAIQRGEVLVLADLDDGPDDEPYEGPFYDFSQHMSPSGVA